MQDVYIVYKYQEAPDGCLLIASVFIISSAIISKQLDVTVTDPWCWGIIWGGLNGSTVVEVEADREEEEESQDGVGVLHLRGERETEREGKGERSSDRAEPDKSKNLYCAMTQGPASGVDERNGKKAPLI